MWIGGIEPDMRSPNGTLVTPDMRSPHDSRQPERDRGMFAGDACDGPDNRAVDSAHMSLLC
jgi:hypothetical protein